MTDFFVLMAVVAAAVTGGLAWRARQGGARRTVGMLTVADRKQLGAPAGVTLLLELTAPACTQCAAARRVLEAVAAGHRDVVVRVVDVTEVPALAERFRVLRAPTVLVADPTGAVRSRFTGVPHAEELERLLSTGFREAA